MCCFFFFQAEDGIRDLVRSRGLGDVYKRQFKNWDLMASPDSKGQTVYQCWYDKLEAGIWKDDLSKVKPMLPLSLIHI